jgi:hypothetical protein
VNKWVFRILTISIAPLGILATQLQMHSLDPYALGYAAVTALIGGILHYVQASADSHPAILGGPKP